MRRITLTLIMALIMPLQALAAPAPSTLYEVQVLVFANHLRKLDGHEHWNEEQNPRIPGLHRALIPGNSLPPGSQLAIAAARLAGHPHYSILAARSWVQNALGLRATQPVRIRSRVDGRLDGVIRVFRWHLLHVAVNLRYHHTGILSGSTAPVYRLITTRPVAINRVNYFDHPKFGVLVLVTPYKGQGLLAPASPG
ncbi:MAG: CsiV family protein [Acidiferrobacter sp.]